MNDKELTINEKILHITLRITLWSKVEPITISNGNIITDIIWIGDDSIRFVHIDPINKAIIFDTSANEYKKDNYMLVSAIHGLVKECKIPFEINDGFYETK